MTDDRISSDVPKPAPTHTPEVVQPTPAPPLTWSLVFANLGVQLLVALVVGVITLITLNWIGSETSTTYGGAVVASVIGFWVARSGVHWPIPRATLKAQAQLPANIHPAETGGREVVETVVFVVVLVLLLKSFAAEAFVIPTGSMAETLYGYQKMVRCPSCGYDFPVNCSQEVDPQDRPQADVTGCTCPNCRRNIKLIRPRSGQSPLPDVQADGSIQIVDPGPSTGDRVLVGKFLYDVPIPGVKAPNRLDVVVFKYPREPQTNGTAMNYIKRLIGLSGETIAICGGDLYVLSRERSPNFEARSAELSKSKTELEGPTNRWKPPFMFENDTEVVDRFKAGEFKILQKPPRIMLSMMRIVYDNDHIDPQLGLVYQRWQPEGEVWEKLDGGKSFRHPTLADKPSENWLRYNHVLRGLEGKKTLITDFMGYNSAETNDHMGREANGSNWVGDLILECEVKVEKAEGELVLELVRAGERYRATFDLASEDGRCTLSHGNKGYETKLESKPTRLRKGTYKVRFANVDRRLTVWVDGSLPFDDGVNYDPPTEKGPSSADLQPASIGVKGATVTIQKIKLHRDTYYTTGGENPNRADVPIQHPDDPREWEGLRNPPVKTLYVQPGHYLCLGDNSPASSDGRSWGMVPERLLLGRALLVYWPAGRAGRIR
jgi:signal peptidase I